MRSWHGGLVCTLVSTQIQAAETRRDRGGSAHLYSSAGLQLSGPSPGRIKSVGVMA